ncbi:MAG TPA: glycosyltransferase [Vicinamibacterales bacterium]|nr:glycosyltransferase [Vicinamibacterales bacterium]
MKIAIVVQRYGADVNGGAELHARYVAEHLAKHLQVEVLTTCATDYITWRNALTPGTDTVNGVSVRRFAVTREREPGEFGRLSERVFTQRHSIRDELTWLEAEGPTSPALIDYIRQNESTFDFFIFFSFRYYHAYHGIRAVAGKSILVPTAERDGALGLSIFAPIFRGVRAFMYNSFEERALIQAVTGNRDVPSVVVGIGSEIPAHSSASRFRQKFAMRDRFAIYVGRIDENKGCGELFTYFQRYTRMLAEGMHLVLIGNPVIPIPEDPKIHHLGFVSDQDKFDALAAAELLIMPSYLESLSMVALEAWALGKPVLANGRCDVLHGQCVRSNGGLYYDNFQEFIETLRAIDFNPTLAATLGRNGREYFNRHYAWPIIERKYLDMIEGLAKGPRPTRLESLPGWFARRRNDRPPANEVVAELPTGPALNEQERAPSAAAAPAVPSAHAALPRPSPPANRSRPQQPWRGSGDRPRSTGPRPHAPRPSSDRDAPAAPGAPKHAGAPKQAAPAGQRQPQSRGPQGQRRRPGGRPQRRPGSK